MVDVTNLENGRTIRVVVAATLDSPGLLAMLSRNAATAIGIQSRGIGRIRMTQPTDSVAYSQNPQTAAETAAPATGLRNNPTLDTMSPTVRDTRRQPLSPNASPEDVFFYTMVDEPRPFQPGAVGSTDSSLYPEPRPVWLLGGTPVAEAPP